MKSFLEKVRLLLGPDQLRSPTKIVRRILRSIAVPPVRSQVTMLPWGLPIRVNTREAIGNTIWKTGFYELAVSEAIWRLLDCGDTGVDAGANIGYMTSIMARRVGPTGKVVAFEPHPDVVRSLLFNISLFQPRLGIGEIRVYDIALSDRSGSGTLTTEKDWIGNQGIAHVTDAILNGKEALAIVVDILDNYFPAETISLLKLDVEGHEAAVLRGAERLINSGRLRTVVYEEHLRSGSATHDILKAAGYSIYSLDRNADGLRLGPSDAERQTANEAPNYLATLDPNEVETRLGPDGWRILRAKGRLNRP